MNTAYKQENLRQNLNPWNFACFSVLLLIIILIIALFLSIFGWLYTYNVFSKEEIIGELMISKKNIKDGISTGTAKLVLYKTDSLINFDRFNTVYDQKREFNFEFNGDQVFIDSYFIRWQNWLTLFGFKPIFKIYRIKSDFVNTESAKKYKRDFIDLSVQQDELFFNYFNNEKLYKFLNVFVQGAFISSVGQNVTNTEQRFNVVVTNDGIVLERK